MSFPTIDADEMAAQVVRYIGVAAEHALAVHGHPDLANAYQRVQNEGNVWPSDAPLYLAREGQQKLRDRLEAILCSPATTVDDYVRISSAAMTLLHLQNDVLTRLPDSESRMVREKINEFRAERRRDIQAANTQGRSRLHPLLPRPPLPIYKRPSLEWLNLRRVTQQDITSLLDPNELQKLVGKQFRLGPDNCDLFFCVQGVEVTANRRLICVQYENTVYPDLVDEDDLKSMLLGCEIVV